MTLRSDKQERETPTPRTDAVASRYPGAGVNFDGLLAHARRLERELDAMASGYRIAMDKLTPSAVGENETPECPKGQDALVAGPAANGASGFKPERCASEETLTSSKQDTCQSIRETLTPDESNRHLTPSSVAPSGAHPEDLCQECGRPNVVWFAPSDLWNKAVRAAGAPEILCPVCFVKRAEAVGIGSTWKVEPVQHEESTVSHAGFIEQLTGRAKRAGSESARTSKAAYREMLANGSEESKS